MSTVIFRTHEAEKVVTAALLILKKPGMEVVTASGGLQRLARMRRGDRLMILGHGSPTSLGGYSAAQLAKVLSDASLPSGIDIELVACNCGAGGNPFALNLKTELVTQKIVPKSVIAGTGYMWVKDDGTPYSKGTNGTEIVEGQRTVSTPWGNRVRNVSPTYGK